MSNKTDHTAAIFDALGITPETHPWAYCPDCGGQGGFDRGGFNEDGEGDGYFEHCGCNANPLCSLLSNSLEADGLAVRLFEFSNPMRIWWDSEKRKWKFGDTESPSFAHAVYAALVEALDINKEGDKPCES